MGRKAVYLADEKSHARDDGLPFDKDEIIKPQTSSPSERLGKLSLALAVAKWIAVSIALTVGVQYLNVALDGMWGDIASPDTQIPKITYPKLHTALSFDFQSPKSFAFTHEAEKSRPHATSANSKAVRVGGEIRVRPMQEPSDIKISVELNINASQPQLFEQEMLGVREDRWALTILTRRDIERDGFVFKEDQTPCMLIFATIWISPGTTIETLGIYSDDLAIMFEPGLNYWTTRSTEISAQSAHFSINGADPPNELVMSSRETVINVDSASITGSYSLYDLLSIHTSSGSMDVQINSQAADKQNVKPAMLKLTSNSGSIRAQIPTTDVTDRDYRTEISTSDGSVDVTLVHGSRTFIRSINGQVNANLYPYGHNDSRTDIETHCNSAAQTIVLHPSLSHPDDPLKKLYGFYHADSGSLNLHYPAQWQGTVTGTIASGSLNVDWKGLKVIKDGTKGWMNKRFEAVRGDGEGTLVFSESTGSFTLTGDSV